MRRRFPSPRALISLLFILVLWAGLQGAAGQAPDPVEKISPAVLADTAAGGRGHFLVVLRNQADTAWVAGLVQPVERGAKVYAALHLAAQRSQPAVIAQLQQLGASYHAYTVVNLIAVEGDRAVVEAMAARSDVAYLTPDRAFRVALESPDRPAAPILPGQIQPAGGSGTPQAAEAPQAVEWNLTWIHADDVWAKGFTGQNIVYANADTGVDWEHAALKPHYRGFDGTTADHAYNWWDAIHQDISGNNGNICGFNITAPCDDYGHGTHTTGIGVGDDNAGAQIGVAPGAKWIACRNMDNGVGRPSTYIECMDFFMAPWDMNHQNPDPGKRPDVVSNSYGCPTSELCGPHDLQAAMENLRNAGTFMAVSAGNNGSSCSTVFDPPGLEDSAITVGATGSNTNTIAPLSSRGPVTVDGSNRRKPDLVAPGIGVRSSLKGGGYGPMSGTSMAAPHVAGAVALIWSAFPALRGNVNLTETLLEQSALHLTTTQGCGGDSPSAVPNNVYGYGLVNVLAAYNEASAPTPGYHYFFPLLLN
jgi:serine protease AprX